jgi:hypothetical protein
MGADIAHGTGETIIWHAGHGEQELAVEIAPGLIFVLCFAFGLSRCHCPRLVGASAMIRQIGAKREIATFGIFGCETTLSH